MIAMTRRSKVPRQATRPTMSMATSTGSMIAAAVTGEMTTAMRGTPTSVSAPPKPPLARPTRSTAGIATR